MAANRNPRKIGFDVLTGDQLHEIHLASARILETTGVTVSCEEALKNFEDAGARVEGELVKIPESLIEDALKTAPDRLILAGPEDGENFLVEKDNVYFGLGTDLPKFLDPYSNQVRPTILEDIENVGKVTDETEEIDFVASLGLASDVPQAIADLYHFRALRSYCLKPLLTTATDQRNLNALIDMAAVLAGGHSELEENPSLLFYAQPVSPLVNSREAVKKLLTCAEYGIPVTYASGVMAGATGPATLAGSIAVGNAECLVGLVMHQLRKAGSPFIYGLVGSIMDMQTAISCYGGPEISLINAVVGQLGRFYELPTYGTGGCTDSNEIDAQSGLEAAFSNFAALLAGTNLVHDNGYLGGGLIGSLEMVLLDNEIISFVRRFIRGIRIDAEALALDVIDQVGPGGDYLAEKHTANHFREETWYPAFLNRLQHEVWETTGRPNLKKKLSERAIEIIEKETPNAITEKQAQQLDEIIAARQSELEISP